MKAFRKSTLSTIVVGLLVTNLSFAADNAGSKALNKSSNLDSLSSETISDKIPVEIDGGLTGELSKSEIDLIKKKKHVLVKYLYEQQELEDARNVLSEENRDKAYEDTKRDRVPLSPDEILELRRMDLDSKKAENAPLAKEGVKLEIRTIDLDVDAPKPIVLNVAAGYASSIVFYDQSGAPWPIDGDIIGDENAFGSKGASKQKHIAVFEIKKEFAESNALINLVDLSVPIVVRLVGHDGIVDSRLSIRIPKFGPSAQVQPFTHSELQNASPEMLDVLNGNKLAGSKRFELIGVPGDVIYKDDSIYVRTRANLISPPWSNSVVSPTGYKVYKLPPVTNLLFSSNGEMVNATVEKGFDVKLTQKNSIYED